MQGLGNDFMVINALDQPFKLSPQEIAKLGDRHYGVGFDQLLILAKSQTTDIDFNYLIYNADGSTAEQCGNGIRCLARFIKEHQLSQKHHFKIQAPKTIMEVLLLDDGQVRSSIGKPDFDPTRLPSTLNPYLAAPYPLNIQGQKIDCYIVNLGNPHAVFKVDDQPQLSLEEVGKVLNQKIIFPEGINVSFIYPIQPNILKLAVYERGVGPTLACGSAACASAVVAIQQNWVSSPVRVQQPGGELIIEWQGGVEEVFMTGPAQTIFKGEIKLE